MAETPDTVFKSRCCPNATSISLPARECLPGDGIHHFDFHSTMHQVRRGPKRLPMRCRRRKLQPAIPNTRSAAPLHSRRYVCSWGAQRTWRSGGERSVDDPKRDIGDAGSNYPNPCDEQAGEPTLRSRLHPSASTGAHQDEIRQHCFVNRILTERRPMESETGTAPPNPKLHDGVPEASCRTGTAANIRPAQRTVSTAKRWQARTS
jgi:hypothetical protein